MSWREDTRHETRQSRRNPRLMLAFSDGQLMGAIFIGLCTLAAAFITGAFQGHAIGLGPIRIAQPAPTVTITRTVTEPPEASITPSAPPPPAPSPATVSILMPIVNQVGWTLAWHENVSIGPQGIILGGSGPQVSDGRNFDMQYVPGDGNGWNDNVNTFDYWQDPYRPGPATIYGIFMSRGNSYDNVAGMQAHTGDRLYSILDVAGRPNRIAYMQIVGMKAGSITADIWLWNAS
jgi:hypothetical protein